MVSVCPFIFKVNIQLILLSLIFIIVNFFLYKKDLSKSMNKVERESYGTIYFPISILFLSFFFWDKPISFFLAVCVLSFADPIASIAGKRSNDHFYPWKDKKSPEGSIAMFCASFLIIAIGTDVMARLFSANFYLPFHILIGLAFFTALCSTASEMISYKGSDNITIPLITFFSYEIFLINYTHGTLDQLIVWLILSVLIFSTAYRFKSLNFSGALGGFLIGILIFGSGGWLLIAPLVFFFVSSSLLSTMKNKPPSQRDILQILANGGLPAFFALSYFFFKEPVFLIGFLGSLSASTADTWATEIGFLSKKRPYLIFTSSQVDKGTSGSISLLGTLSSVVGAFFIGLISYFILEIEHTIELITFAGCIGSFIDTILGRYIQGKFYCVNSNVTVEHRYQNGSENALISGFKWIDNNLVNFTANLSGAVVSIVIISVYG